MAVTDRLSLLVKGIKILVFACKLNYMYVTTGYNQSVTGCGFCWVTTTCLRWEPQSVTLWLYPVATLVMEFSYNKRLISTFKYVEILNNLISDFEINLWEILKLNLQRSGIPLLFDNITTAQTCTNNQISPQITRFKSFKFRSTNRVLPKLSTMSEIKPGAYKTNTHCLNVYFYIVRLNIRQTCLVANLL